MIRCAACGETRRAVTLWRQIVALDSETVCCWPDTLVKPALDTPPVDAA